MKDVLLVGAGHAHVEVLRRFGLRPVSDTRLTLLTRELHTPYSGMLPGVVAGHYDNEDAHIDTGRLAQFAGAVLHLDEAVGIDREARRVLRRNGPSLPFDLLSLDIGSRPNTGHVPGAAAYAIPVKPIDGFLARFEDLRARVQAGQSRHVLLVGGGAGGVELLLAVAHRLRREAGALCFTLVTGSPDILPGFPTSFRTRCRMTLMQHGVAVHAGVRVAAVEPGSVILADGTRLAADENLWTTEAAASPWLADTGLPLDATGFLNVDSTLRAAPGVFAAGDMIAFGPSGIPRSGVYAVRAGTVLAHNLRASLTGGRLRRYRPQPSALTILSTGDRHAILTRNGMTLEGYWAWRLKDWIDRRFMDRFNDLPQPASTRAKTARPI